MDHKDLEEFVALLEKTLTSHFDLQFDSICPEKQTPIFGSFLSLHIKRGERECCCDSSTVSCETGDFMNESSVYEDLQDRNSLKKFMQTQLEDYNETPGLVPMNLVLFQDAIEHGP